MSNIRIGSQKLLLIKFCEFCKKFFSKTKNKLIIIFCVVLICLSCTAYFKTYQLKLDDTITEVYKVISLPTLWLYNIYSGLVEKVDIFVNTKEIKEENVLLKSRMKEFELLSIENKLLKNVLNYMSDLNQEYITTRVVLENVNIEGKKYLVNIGKDHGINEGYAAVNENGLIGRVIEVGKNSSRVLLITDIASKIPAISLNSGIQCMVVGNHKNAYLLLKYIPENVQLEDGENIITSGEGQVMPYGINIGKVVYKNGQYMLKPYNNFNKSIIFISIIKLLNR